MKKGPKKDIAVAEYHYFIGHPNEAAQETEMYLTCTDPELRLSACLIYAYSNLSIGQIQQARYGFRRDKEHIESRYRENASCQIDRRVYFSGSSSPAASSAAGRAAGYAGVHALTSYRTEGVCAVCTGALSLSPEKNMNTVSAS